MDITPALLFEKIIQGDRVSLGLAMTLVESERYDDRKEAIALLALCEQQLEKKDESIRFAISGAPGVGKSTLIESLGLQAIDRGYKVGVITVDPTSTISHGSILGDKSRMTRLSVSPSAFIRSSAAGSVLGGIGRRSYEMMTLLAAVGYNLILLETVGVGQSEHTSWQFTDGLILVLQPGGGDELQGIKRGITELADIIIINKADGKLKDLASVAKSQYQTAIHYFSLIRSYWTPKVLTCSALEGDGIDAILEMLRSYHDHVLKNTSLASERTQQKIAWLSWSLGNTAHQLLLNHPMVQEKLKAAHIEMNNKNTSLFKTEFGIENVMQSLIDPSYKTNK